MQLDSTTVTILALALMGRGRARFDDILLPLLLCGMGQQPAPQTAPAVALQPTPQPVAPQPTSAWVAPQSTSSAMPLAMLLLLGDGRLFRRRHFEDEEDDED